MAVRLDLPPDYGFVGFGIAALAIVQFGLGARAMSLRYYFKTEDFRNNPKIKAIQEEHKKTFGADINEFGYPDMGNGRYFEALPYDYWVKFNNYQRAHYNMIENSAYMFACALFNGIMFPKFSAGISVLHAVGRIVYAIGYTTKRGADGRLVGATIGTITQAAAIFTAVYIAVQSIR